MEAEFDEASHESPQMRYNVIDRPPASVYAGRIRCAFENVPRMWHAKGFPVKAATFGLPDFDGQNLNFRRFHTTGYAIIPGESNPHYSAALLRQALQIMSFIGILP